MKPPGVSGIELMPIFVVVRDEDVYNVSQADYVQGVPLQDLISGLEAGQHVYLVHLDDPGPGLGIKLTLLI